MNRYGQQGLSRGNGSVRIGWFLFLRLATPSLTADSVRAVETGRLAPGNARSNWAGGWKKSESGGDCIPEHRNLETWVPASKGVLGMTDRIRDGPGRFGRRLVGCSDSDEAEVYPGVRPRVVGAQSFEPVDTESRKSVKS